MSWLPRRDERQERRSERRERNRIPTGPTAEQLYSGPAAFSGYRPEAATGDPAAMQQARTALGRMATIAGGGTTSADQAAMRQAQFTGEQASRSALDAIAQQAAMRGTGGGGLDYLARAAAAQSGANMTAQLAAEQAQAMQARQMQALQGTAALGLGLDTQAMQHGAAIDEFNRFATGARSGALQQGYENTMARWQAEQEQRRQRLQAITGIISAAGDLFS